MQYALLIYGEEGRWEQLSEAEQQAMTEEYMAISRDPKTKGGADLGDPLEAIARAGALEGVGALADRLEVSRPQRLPQLGHVLPPDLQETRDQVHQVRVHHVPRLAEAAGQSVRQLDLLGLVGVLTRRDDRPREPSR